MLEDVKPGTRDILLRVRDEDLPSAFVHGVIVDESGDLHIPHYIELFGGLVFFPPELRVFERRRLSAHNL